MTKARILKDRIAVFAIDPGGITGCARGTFEIRETIADTLNGGSWESWESEGDAQEQADEIGTEFLDWYYELHVEKGWPADSIVLVIETFELRQMAVELSPVEVTSAVLTVIGGRVAPEYQGPGDAKGFATNDRLRAWGLWIVGLKKDHRRDAARHMALRVAREVDG